jgi:hypothetical protein
MNLKDALMYLVSLGEAKVHTLDDDREFSDKQLHPLISPAPDSVKFHSLEGFVDFTKKFISDSDTDPGEFIVHVKSHCEISLLGAHFDSWSRIHSFASAHIWKGANDFVFGQWYDSEQFIINLQALFVSDVNRAKVLAVVGNMTSERAVSNEDDGITQTVGQKQGVVLKSKAEVPNPVALRPYRTFMEVEQPASEFIFRVRQGREGQMPQCALFEADGGKWKLEAANNVKIFLESKFADAAYKVLM